MSFLSRWFGSSSQRAGAPVFDELRTISNSYIEQWADGNAAYDCWKPDTLLPATKPIVKRALMLCYAEWPDPIDWTIYSSFFMEFVDLARHIPSDEYAQIELFRQGRVRELGNEHHDPLQTFRISSTLAVGRDQASNINTIVRIRDGMQRSQIWDPIDADDCALRAARRIVLESAVEYAVLCEEWRFYTTSIGRNR